jgi:hypothetical protein
MVAELCRLGWQVLMALILLNPLHAVLEILKLLVSLVEPFLEATSMEPQADGAAVLVAPRRSSQMATRGVVRFKEVPVAVLAGALAVMALPPMPEERVGVLPELLEAEARGALNQPL